ncbi:ferritin [Pedobacter sp. P26]|uniref:ferritin n=1 Tax=Pedobacter sp. P26 TaxID=3423956 RepID=UPI003D66F0CA
MLLSERMLEALNNQVKLEAESSQVYLGIASWLETQPGLEGYTEFFYRQSDEERHHMLKLIHYINDRDGHAVITALEMPKNSFSQVIEVFQDFLDNELLVSKSINDLVELSLNEKDYLTFKFLQWYLDEQLEEEKMAKTMLEKLQLVGSDRGGIYQLDKDIVGLRSKVSETKEGE